MKRSNNYNAVNGAAKFSENALQSFSARLNFSPDLVYIMPSQICFAHKLKEPLEFNGNSYEAINSVAMVGVDSNLVPVELKIVPVSNLSRMYYNTPDVNAVEKEKGWRGAIDMLPASNISEVVERHGEDGRKVSVPVAYKVRKETAYLPQIEKAGNKWDFKNDGTKLELNEKIISIFDDVEYPEDVKIYDMIPDDLKDYIL